MNWLTMSYNLHLSFELISQIYELIHQLYDLEKMMPVDPLMLRVTKKIQVDKNITTWPKYYELAIILRVNESTVSWGKLIPGVKERYEKPTQIVKFLKIA